MSLTPRTLTADRGDAGVRLDLVVRRHLSGEPLATRTRVQAWIEDGLVRVNDRLVRRPSARTAYGDLVAVHVAFPSPRPMAAEPGPLDVVLEDEHLLVVNKPAGLVVHPTCGHAEGTLMNALLWHARDWPAGSRPSLVSRLDRLTSGLVLVARSAPAHASLQRAMASPRAVKEYLAVVHGYVSPASGAIDLRLRRDPGDRRRVVAGQQGAESLTRFERLDRVGTKPAGFSAVACRLLTGRTHQIRVHLAARGWPIVGDTTYGGQLRGSEVGPGLGEAVRAFPRQALHAWRLAFTHPVTGRKVTVEAPLPADILDLLRVTGLAITSPGRAPRRGFA